MGIIILGSSAPELTVPYSSCRIIIPICFANKQSEKICKVGASSCFINARRYSLSYVFSGRYLWGDGTLNYQDSYGYWWATTTYSDSNAYRLGMGSSVLNSQGNDSKAFGFALRCVSYSTKYPSISAFVCIVRSLWLEY
ncbi:hypothetical protein IJH16_03450 [Candidatus Saccharibacteria bacterium]|nr:hypothetical protein [Candidatus Saccharibacteria bacterium]